MLFRGGNNNIVKLERENEKIMENKIFNKDSKQVKENKGVLCDVCNCVYHNGENHCTATKINVGPSYATSCTDTVCATFKQKNI